jgi:hypothetical protein
MKRLAIASIAAALFVVALAVTPASAYLPPVPADWSGGWGSSHCDNAGNAEYWSEHDFGSQPGNSEYHFNPMDQSESGENSCNGPTNDPNSPVNPSVTFAGYLNVPVNPACVVDSDNPADDPVCDPASDPGAGAGGSYLSQPGNCGSSNPRNPDCDSLGGVAVGADTGGGGPKAGPVGVYDCSSGKVGAGSTTPLTGGTCPND